MKIYNYDRQTGVFLGASVAEPNPMEPGNFLVPAFSTAIAPPAAVGNEKATFNAVKGRWAVVEAPAQTPTPTPELEAVTFEEKRDFWRGTVARNINIVAVGLDFNSIDEAVSYAEEPAVPQFQALGRALRAWRSLAWAAFDAIMAEIRDGVGVEPTSDANLIDRLPKYLPPDVEAQCVRFVAPPPVEVVALPQIEWVEPGPPPPGFEAGNPGPPPPGYATNPAPAP